MNLPRPTARLLLLPLAALLGALTLLTAPINAEDDPAAGLDPPAGPVTLEIVPDGLGGWALPDPPKPGKTTGDDTLGDKERARLYGFGEPESGDGAFRSGKKPPPSHTSDFMKRHGAIARASTAECGSCHREQECLDCHQGLTRPLSVHSPAYIEIHAQEAYRQSWSCTTCHTPQLFCRSCHALARAGSTGAAAPQPGVRFHPEGWLGRTPGPDHGRQARRNLMACASCHQEKDCVRCHATLNPHPSTFIATCKTLLQRNARACVRCHTNPEALRAICR